MSTAAADSTHSELLGMIAGCWVSRALHIAAEFGIADLLATGPATCTTLAALTGTREAALYRVLRALASVGVFAEEQDRTFRLTPLAGHLRSAAPESLRGFALMLGEREHWRSWEGILHTVRTGEPAFDNVFGAPLFDYLAAHPAAARTFDEAMTSRSNAENERIVAACSFAASDIVVDVGGGQGTLMASILEAHRDVRGILFDLPHVLARCHSRIQSARQAGRCALADGDFFSAVPAAGSVYLLKRVIHDWDDERAVGILANCRRAMNGAARLLLIEPVIPPGNAPSFNKLLDLVMLAWHRGGRERTEAEHCDLLASAGLRLERVIPTASAVTILEAVRV